jgi:tetratricopeptide (TPR) repeat protein
VKRDEALAKAATATGDERAVLLDAAISAIDVEIASVYYEDIIGEIVELDKEDELGLRTKWNEFKDSELRKMMLTDIFMRSRLEKPDRALAFIDEVLGQIPFPPDQKMQILQIKLNLLRAMNDNRGMDNLLDEMIEMEGVEGDTRQRLIIKKIYLLVGTGRRDEAMKLLEDALSSNEDQLQLWLGRGEILDAEGKFREAIAAYDRAMERAGQFPDILIELSAAKADAHVSLNEIEAALQTLDQFADDPQMPADLRGEALLHKAMIMRQSDRRRQARLAENRAIEIAETPIEKAEMQKLVDRLRQKYGD